MKYMGSKRSMLSNGLGELLIQKSRNANRIFDPFCGSSSVVWFLAEKTNRQVIAGDLQKYSTDLANSILLRDSLLKDSDLVILENWINLSKAFHDVVKADLKLKVTKKCVFENRALSAKSFYYICSAYGGYYFSHDQALKLDSLLNFLPENEPLRSIAISALIEAASQCVAAPGHTAQPFQPEGNGLTSILEAWKRDPFYYTERFIKDISGRHAQKIGVAITSEASVLLDKLEEGDLVFLDPPYSGVHYSRFYHVLETISRNSFVKVSGRGRYPSKKERPVSDYSLRAKSKTSLTSLLSTVSLKGSSAIMTFPAHECSNGLSGKIVTEIAKKYFTVKKEIIKGRFSTLGGNNDHRPARQESAELVLLLTQK